MGWAVEGNGLARMYSHFDGFRLRPPPSTPAWKPSKEGERRGGERGPRGLAGVADEAVVGVEGRLVHQAPRGACLRTSFGNGSVKACGDEQGPRRAPC